MANVEIRSIQRSMKRDRERLVVHGKIHVTTDQNTHPAGSYLMRHIDGIVLGPDPSFAKRQVVGSVVDPQAPGVNNFNNSVRLRVKITGTLGTRNTSQAQIGSNAGAGTTGQAYFTAWGY